MVVSTLLTAFRHHLGTSLADLEWTVSAYTLSFAVSSAGCAWPPDAAALIAARTVQGAGSATIMPVALALLNAAVSAPRSPPPEATPPPPRSATGSSPPSAPRRASPSPGPQPGRSCRDTETGPKAVLFSACGLPHTAGTTWPCRRYRSNWY